MIGVLKPPHKDIWHVVLPQDRSRIKCEDCDLFAFACQHWTHGGAPFFYYCYTHAVERGFTK